MNLLNFYIDTLDTNAFDKAESGQLINPRFDWPILPFLVPLAVIVGPALALFPKESGLYQALVLLAFGLAVTVYVWVGLFYNRRVRAYREQLGVEVD